MIKLFYPLGKCIEQVVANKNESRIFVSILLSNAKIFLEEHPEILEHETILREIKVEDQFHYIKTVEEEHGITKRIGFRFSKQQDELILDICEYRLLYRQVFSKLLGRLCYNLLTSEIEIVSVCYFSSIQNGLCLARIPETHVVKNSKTYFKKVS